jgi:hypothetical protein
MPAREWKSLIESAMQSRPPPIQAMTYGEMKWATGSHPVLLRCSDGSDYVVKGKQVGGALVTEQIVGALGTLLGAPVPKMHLVDVSADLIAKEGNLTHMHAGVAHGCLYVANCVGPTWIEHQDVPENKARHARLAILYGWVQPGDRQLLYELSKPPRVWSVDHGGFSVCVSGIAEPYVDIVRAAQIKPEDLAAVKPELEAAGPESLARAVASPHESWGITIEERVAFAQHLEQKRTELISSLA